MSIQALKQLTVEVLRESAGKIDFYQQTLDCTGDAARTTVAGLTAQDGTSGNTWRGVDFANCHFSLAGRRSVFSDCSFTDCKLTSGGVELTRCEIADTELSLDHCDIRESSIAKSTLSLETSCADSLDHCKISETKMGRNFSESQWSDCTFHDVIFRNADFRDGRWERCSFTRTEFEHSTNFVRMEFSDIGIDPVFLESLGVNRDSLTDNQLRRMTVRDPIAELRILMGGHMFYLHSVALIAFISPYLCFVLMKWAQYLMHSVTSDAPTETLASALMRFWFNGGWQVNFLTVIPSCVFLILQLVRLSLMLKVKSIERERAIRSIWPHFDERELVPYLHRIPLIGPHISWLRLQQSLKVGTYAAVVFGLIHVLGFGLLPVPIGGMR